ncbi:hypothetical protein J1N35_041270 [Gossypium stocksii]|uniref:Reverse transcriptase Ty1/copia-type domain-containing protein n=1 Tax=Gossypium stocksii TaxID=47602 RepID=A0A9D3UF60_9ROSI|nr:hypothetical protein J1N35_041270 [Gossypium stocksii]
MALDKLNEEFQGSKKPRADNCSLCTRAKKSKQMEEHSEGTFQAKSRGSSSSSSNFKGKKLWTEKKEKDKNGAAKKKFLPCDHCKKTTHLKKYFWYRLDIQCRASCFARLSKVSKNWQIDSGCTHHMASDKSMFKELDTTFVSKVRIGNGELLEAKGKGKAMIGIKSGDKTIFEVLYVPDIDQNLLSVGQLLEKGYSLSFEARTCVIRDAINQVLTIVAILDRAFILFCWVSFLKQKSNMADFFCKFKALASQANFRGKTPFEAWFGPKPTVSHLKVFGCLCYVLVPAEKRTKLGKRSLPGVFVGYSSVKKGYRVFAPSTNNIVVSRDVKFNEASCWKWDGTVVSLLEED